MTARSGGTTIELHSVRSASELAEAEQLLDAWLPTWTRGRRGRDFYRVRYPDQADLMVVARAGRMVGTALLHLDGAGSVTVGAIAVDAAVRRRGIGQQLLTLAEDQAAARGVTRCNLGVADGAETFYLACGYDVGLLVQIPPDVPDADALVATLLRGPLRGHDCQRAAFNGWPQIRVRLPGLDNQLLAGLRDAAPAASVGYTMSKQLKPAGLG